VGRRRHSGSRHSRCGRRLMAGTPGLLHVFKRPRQHDCSTSRPRSGAYRAQHHRSIDESTQLDATKSVHAVCICRPTRSRLWGDGPAPVLVLLNHLASQRARLQRKPSWYFRVRGTPELQRSCSPRAACPRELEIAASTRISHCTPISTVIHGARAVAICAHGSASTHGQCRTCQTAIPDCWPPAFTSLRPNNKSNTPTCRSIVSSGDSRSAWLTHYFTRPQCVRSAGVQTLRDPAERVMRSTSVRNLLRHARLLPLFNASEAQSVFRHRAAMPGSAFTPSLLLAMTFGGSIGAQLIISGREMGLELEMADVEVESPCTGWPRSGRLPREKKILTACRNTTPDEYLYGTAALG